jgi:thiamine biosynthesis lipoprotein
MPGVSRRRFLLALGAGGALAGATVTRLRRQAIGQSFAATALHSVTRSAAALGSRVSITALDADPRQAERAIAASFAALERIEQLMSLYRPDSQLCRLNRDGALASPHPDLVEVLLAAQSMAQRSGGAFDVTVQPLWQLFQSAQRNNRLPTSEEIGPVRALVDHTKLNVSGQRVELADNSMAVTLNGIAQGFAADRVAAVLSQQGISHALVDTGELAALGHNETQQPWTAGIQHPRHADAFCALAALEGRALATSGDYATRFGHSDRNHHIFDPRTGHSPTELASVSVAAATAMEADALSTAIMVLGAKRGMELVTSTPNADALLVLKDGHTHSTSAFPAIPEEV